MRQTRNTLSQEIRVQSIQLPNRHLAATFGDADTADLFTQVSRSADRQLWLVESHVPPA